MDQRRSWIAFVVLGAIWGSSFLFIKIALADLGPLTLVACRLLAGLLFLLPLGIHHQSEIPRDISSWLGLAFLGLVGVLLPFTLISWGEQVVSSGMASLLNATTPLFAILIADVWLKDTSVTGGKLGGLALGFVGIVILVGDSLTGTVEPELLPHQLAVVGASAAYAISNAFTRRKLMHLTPLVLAFGQLLWADLFAWIGAMMLEPEVTTILPRLLEPQHGRTLFAVLWLGVLGSGVAYLLFYYLVKSWGATRAALVTYVLPLIGVVLGTLALQEPFTWRLLVGGGLVVGGVGLVNRRPRRPHADS